MTDDLDSHVRRQLIEAHVAVGFDDVGVIEMTHRSIRIHGHEHWANVCLPHTYTCHWHYQSHTELQYTLSLVADSWLSACVCTGQ